MWLHSACLVQDWVMDCPTMPRSAPSAPFTWSVARWHSRTGRCLALHRPFPFLLPDEFRGSHGAELGTNGHHISPGSKTIETVLLTRQTSAQSMKCAETCGWPGAHISFTATINPTRHGHCLILRFNYVISIHKKRQFVFVCSVDC